MINYKQNLRIIDKVIKATREYDAFLVSEKIELDTYIFESDISAFDLNKDNIGNVYQKETLKTPPKNAEYKKISIGQKWGNEFSYAYFKIDLKKVKSLKSDNIYLYNNNGAVENLIFVDNKPVGMFDVCDNVKDLCFRIHKYFKLDKNDLDKDVILEGYHSHTFYGVMPYEKKQTFSINGYREGSIFNGIYAVVIDKTVEEFIDNMYLLRSLYLSYENKDEFKTAKYTNLFIEIFKSLEQMPLQRFDNNIITKLQTINKLITSVLGIQENINSQTIESNKKDYNIGIIGHSHLDTAWLWTVEETKHKLARTVANAIQILKTDKDYKFMLSSVLYMDWLKKYYPSLYEDAVIFIKQGRFEINGATWVECDCNLVGSESLARQFVKGQRWLKDNLGFYNDTFWLLDTFGYSASIPQIIKKSKAKYFVTTKLSWNDTNKFPYDTFVWQGIDSTPVLTHFTSIQQYVEPETINNRVRNIQNKHLNDKALFTYGFGDGGGGPSKKMVEYANATSKIADVAPIKHVTVTEFMSDLDKNLENFPIYRGELYLELHRGTLTSNHILKKYNRLNEINLHDLEFLLSLSNLDNKVKSDFKQEIDVMYETLLLNQFHDILPGTCIKEANILAKQQLLDLDKSANILKQKIVEKQPIKDKLTIVNTLPFNRNNVINLNGDYNLLNENIKTQKFTDFNGDVKTAINLSIDANSSVTLEKSNNGISNNKAKIKDNQTTDKFKTTLKNKKLESLQTPYYFIEFNDDLSFKSVIDKEENREIVKGDFFKYSFYEDVPSLWDNWDIDADYVYKKCNSVKLLSYEIVSNGDLEFRLRVNYKLSDKSSITTDIIFYSNDKLIEFESKLDYNEQHRLLKVDFDCDILASSIKNEIQFGYVERSMLDNTSIEQAQFETCNHKWSDISENNYGIAFLNDCKYGLSAKNSLISLTLYKNGARPDNAIENESITMRYAILPHKNSFNTQNTILPAYQFNYKPLVFDNADFQINSIYKVNKENIIIETIKPSEEDNNTVLRLYESSCNRTNVTLTVPNGAKIYATDILENIEFEIENKNGLVDLNFAPFEIKTLLVK